MTERLYYHNSFLYDFVAALMERRTLPDGRTALVLDRTVFYPTSGGQVFDTGWLEVEPLEGEAAGSRPKLRVAEVIDEESTGEILHVVEAVGGEQLPEGMARVRGFVDVDRRRDHMQQHSAQHVLSAAFVELFQMPTVSFHMGEESCTIDLDAKSLSIEQARQAEMRANQVVWDDRTVAMHYVTADEAKAMGVRKIPPVEREKLRLVDIKDFDLCACGGTHVKSTGQIGAVLVRKIEKVKQGYRVEFVAGARAVSTARKDYETLAEAGTLFSTQLWEVPSQIRKNQEDAKGAVKQQHRLHEEIAELQAVKILAETPEDKGEKIVSMVLADRELGFVKLLAQRLTAASKNCVALLGAASGQPALVFAQSRGMKHDMGALMKDAMAALGSRGGGNRDMAQGGAPDANRLAEIIEKSAAKVRTEI
jgi:alanyl-tRNA synthetase